MLSDWPVDRPRSWLAEVNRPWDEPELERLRQSVVRGAPLGSANWTQSIAARLDLGSTLRPRGRPSKTSK